MPNFRIRIDLSPQPFRHSLNSLEESYQNIRRDLDSLFRRLEADGPQMNRSIGHGVYKERCASSDMQRGKRGGFRVLIYRRGADLIPLLIYAKADREDVTDDEIRALITSLQEP